jgi:hypothetical protein
VRTRRRHFRYIVAVGLLAFIYTTLQLVRHGVRLSGGQDLQGKVGLLVDFAGDQVSKETLALNSTSAILAVAVLAFVSVSRIDNCHR